MRVELPRLREQLGGQHPATVTAMANLASLYVETRRYDAGAELLQQVMEVHRARLPDDHPSLLADLANLSVLRLNPEEA